MSFAQLLDTSHQHDYTGINTFIASEQALTWFNEDSTAIDTSLFGFEASYPAMKMKLPVLDLGYEGSPILRLDHVVLPTDEFSLGIPALRAHFYDEEIRRIHTDKAFTRLNYAQGESELVFIEAQHGQQFSERLTLGMDYRRLKNHNFYFANIANPDNVRFANIFNTKIYTGYYSPQRNYEMLASYSWNRNSSFESGGLDNTDDFEQFSGRSKLDNNFVSLTNARSNLTRHQIRLKQFFRKKVVKADSSKATLQDYTSQWIWDTKLTTERLEYLDLAPDSAYYGATYDEVYDSMQHSQVRNDLTYVFRTSELSFRMGMVHAWNRFYMDSTVWTYHHLKPNLQVQQQIKSFSHSLHASAVLTGYNQGNYTLAYQLRDEHLQGSLWIKGLSPFRIDQQFRGNVQQWDNNFDQIQDLGYAIDYVVYEAARVESAVFINGNHSSGLVYYDSTGLPAQHKDRVDFIRLGSSFSFRSKALSFATNISYQYSSDQLSLPRPEWLAKASAYTTIFLFDKNLETQWGLSSYWFSDFNAPRYDPVTSRWVNQEQEFAMYPPIQVMVNAKVKSFNFGLHMWHAQQGFMGEAYYSSPAYPMMPRVIRLNIRWDLNN